MADDGMLLNFSLGDGVLNSKPTYKGGRWKDRFIAKKAAAGRSRRRPEAASEQHPKPGTFVNREEKIGSQKSELSVRAKRPRIEGDFRPVATANGGNESREPRQRPTHAGADSGRGPPKQIISSLFTYNPVSQSQPEPKPQDDAPVEPSNAPLSGELETFTSLGLSASIASHLLEKMELRAPTAIQKAAVPQLVDGDSDAFIQAETGSGKTLAYLLPILHRIMKISGLGAGGKGNVHRDSGLFAIILAPTRELSKQIAAVLEVLLRCAHPLVAGTVLGGEKKKSEKARLRKGLNILVATPGRLADHLDHTEVLDVSNVRWLVLDEGDRLMELGFEDDIQKIVRKLDMRLKLPKKSAGHSIPGLPSKRTTILCSATMKMDVQRLGEISLKDAIHVKAEHADEENVASTNGAAIADGSGSADTFSAPAQLKQSYAVVPAKLRLVSLIAYLRRAFARHGSIMKAIVFISCADSVDFHFDILANTPWPLDEENPPPADPTQPPSDTKTSQTTTPTHATSAILFPTTTTTSSTNPPPPVTVYRLHGTLPQPVRTSTLHHFTTNRSPSVLLSTDLASRGLDVPHVDLILEFDPAFSRAEHIHRVGRTARAGREGRACVFLMPGPEESYVDAVLRRDRPAGTSGGLARTTAEEILARGFPPSASSAGVAATDTATDLQLAVERALLQPQQPHHHHHPPSSKSPSRGAGSGSGATGGRLELAKRAFASHVRAYATHVAAERGCFDIAQLHLGHLCKAFALRERPGGIGAGLERRAGKKGGKKERRGEGEGGGRDGGGVEKARAAPGMADVDDAAAKMRRKIREQNAMKAGASEFNLG